MMGQLESERQVTVDLSKLMQSGIQRLRARWSLANKDTYPPNNCQLRKFLELFRVQQSSKMITD